MSDTSGSSTAELLAAIEAAAESFASFVETLTDEQFTRRPAPDEWTAAEITGHVSEAPTTFATHARRVAESGGGEVGRAPDDPGRLAAVARLAGRDQQAGAQLVRAGIREACDILRAIPDDAWQTEGEHVRLGRISVRGLVEYAILNHIRGHQNQAKEAAGL